VKLRNHEIIRKAKEGICGLPSAKTKKNRKCNVFLLVKVVKIKNDVNVWFAKTLKRSAFVGALATSLIPIWHVMMFDERVLCCNFIPSVVICIPSLDCAGMINLCPADNDEWMHCAESDNLSLNSLKGHMKVLSATCF